MEKVMLCEFCDVVMLWCKIITSEILQQYLLIVIMVPFAAVQHPSIVVVFLHFFVR
jgi:hypothetical protein